jgi:3-hydroxyacyl-[acyl-carrier-protein] dehydratase
VNLPLGSKEIQQLIPHRWPFLLVDRVLELEPGARAVGLKQVSGGEIFFQGHFPGNPILPAVLTVEALAQVGCVAILSDERYKGKLVVFAGMDNFRFKRPVVPGDSLRLEVKLTRILGPVGKGTCIASVDGQTAAEGQLLFALVDPQTLGATPPA